MTDKGKNTDILKITSPFREIPDIESSIRENLRLKDKGLVAILNVIARDMPEGYYIEVGVELGSAWVNLFGPDMEKIEYPSNQETPLESIEDAFNFACMLASYGTAWKEHIND